MFDAHFAFQYEQYNIEVVVEGMLEVACPDIGIGQLAAVQDVFDEEYQNIHGVKSEWQLSLLWRISCCR